MNTLIADCGSTKAHWILLTSGSYEPAADFITTGFNAAVTPREIIRGILTSEVCPALTGHKIDRISFYGAGCIGGETDRNLSLLLSEALSSKDIEISSDLLAAARALFGQEKGIACILGTGSNSGLYNGEEIILNTPPLGYILGDEGSGAVLGKRLVGDIFKGLLPEEILDDFEATYHLSKQELIERVYRQPAANRYLASFCPFLSSHIDHPAIKSLLTEEFNRFFDRNLSQYSSTPFSSLSSIPNNSANPDNKPDSNPNHYHNHDQNHNQNHNQNHILISNQNFNHKSSDKDNVLPVGFIGSIAYHFAPIITAICLSRSLPSPNILQSPIKGLIAYHTQQ